MYNESGSTNPSVATLTICTIGAGNNFLNVADITNPIGRNMYRVDLEVIVCLIL